jgi:hypothetical protein
MDYVVTAWRVFEMGGYHSFSCFLFCRIALPSALGRYLFNF